MLIFSSSFSRAGGPAAGSGGGGGRGAGSVPGAAAGAQEPVGPGAELRVVAALGGGGASRWPAGHRPADHPGRQVSRGAGIQRGAKLQPAKNTVKLRDNVL